eukprot:scaffold78127_cov69-Phaeocystis_antarctica.AAC.1
MCSSTGDSAVRLKPRAEDGGNEMVTREYSKTRLRSLLLVGMDVTKMRGHRRCSNYKSAVDAAVSVSREIGMRVKTGKILDLYRYRITGTVLSKRPLTPTCGRAERVSSEGKLHGKVTSFSTWHSSRKTVDARGCPRGSAGPQNAATVPGHGTAAGCSSGLGILPRAR